MAPSSGVPLSRALVLLGVAAGAAGAGVGISSSRSPSAPPPVAATAPAVTTAPAPATAPSPSTTTAPATTTAPPPPAATATTPPAPAPAPAPRPALHGSWPAGRDGYTNVLLSIAVSAGRAEADAQARAARRAGLPQVGVLLSSSFPSLRPGYWVVFSGVYRSAAAAQKGLANLRLRGYTDAYPRRVGR